MVRGGQWVGGAHYNKLPQYHYGSVAVFVEQICVISIICHTQTLWHMHSFKPYLFD